MPYILGKFHIGMLAPRILLYVVCHILQICRLQAVRLAFIEAEKYSTWSYTVIGCAKILLMAFFLMHSPACLFYCLSKVSQDAWIVDDNLSNNIFHLYGNAFYWSVTTFMSVGYEDVTSKKMLDKVCVGIYMFTNIISYTYITGCVANIIVAGNTKMTELWKKSRFMRRLLDMNGTSYIREQIIQHIELEHSLFHEQIGQSQQIDSLPEILREQFKFKITNILKNDGLFENVPLYVLYELIFEMYSVYVSSKDIIIKREAKPTHFYLLLHGSVDIRRAADQMQPQRVTGQSILGLRAFVSNAIHQETIWTYDVCHMVKLERTKFFKVIRQNPGVGKVILDNFRTIHRDLHVDMQQKILNGTLDDYFTITDELTRKIGV